MQTPTENIIPLTCPSFKLIFAAVIFNNPGGTTPINATNSPKKKIIVMLNVI